MTNVYELRATARRARRAWQELATYATTPPAPPRLARNMVPVFGPSSPTPDGDWAVSLTDSLLRETTEERVPGGLLVMARDALTTIGEHDRACDRDPVILCMHIAYTAGPICDSFPAADELVELLDEQAGYILDQINRRYPPPPDGPGQAVKRHGAEYTAARLRARGHDVTADMVRGWARRGHITRVVMPNGRGGYLIGECLAHLESLV